MADLNYEELLNYIPAAELSYQEWVGVGMALKEAGCDCSTWDEWSRSDARYHSGECSQKWQSFNGSAFPITAGTLVHMAQERGWKPKQETYELDWTSEIGADEIDIGWIEAQPISEPDTWSPVQEVITYLSTLYENDDYVAYCIESFERDDGKRSPTRGVCDRTAGQLISELKRYNDIGAALGDYDPEAGAWVKFNPCDGQGTRNDNTTAYRYALVECDNVDKELQLGLYKAQNLPIAIVVDSGNKSVHAIVHVDANDYQEYRKRVNKLYDILRASGIDVDTQNKNPSRWSRLPGVMRSGKKQFIVEGASGPATWDEWQEWIAAQNDDLPEFDSLESADIPELPTPIIEGVLRRGHKMMVSGPSKAGKSFALISLSLSLANGAAWFGWQCRKSKVLYINFELSRESCLNRFDVIVKATGASRAGVDIWNLRGKVTNLKELLPKLLHRMQVRNYDAVIFDPIYKIMGGDENNAEQVGRFLGLLDRVCSETGASVIYCHHHSKGAQGAKGAMDRASGSGVFARDADALIDMIQLRVPSGSASFEGYSDTATAWRVEPVLREFATLDPRGVWFDYPLHIVDASGAIDSWKPETGQPSISDLNDNRERKENERVALALEEFERLLETGETPSVRLQDICNRVGVTPQTAADYFDKSKFVIYGSVVNRYENGKIKPSEAIVMRKRLYSK